MHYYYDVYKRSWKKGESIGPTFHRDFAKLAAEKGWLRLGFLFLNNLPIAAQFRIVSNGLAYFLKTSYDQNYRSFAPGIILLSKMIPYLLDNDKVTEIDYGSGDESYKGNWVCDKREIRRLLVFNNNPRAKYLTLLMMKILPFFERHRALRKIKHLISSKIHGTRE
jgi:CelD/BcsL family acetyltransferase involved in cellulose biosynthesis